MLNETTSSFTINAEDTRLIERAQQNDSWAQRLIYQQYVKAMYHMAIRMVGNREDAEDVTQEVFSNVFYRLDSFKGESTLGAWIKRITINTALNFLRKKKKIVFEEFTELAVADEPQQTEKETPLNIKEIHDAVKELPDGCRMVFNLYLLEGYNHTEVAEILNISESTSKTQYRRAKRLIKEKILQK